MGNIVTLSIEAGQYQCGADGWPHSWVWTLRRPGMGEVYARVWLPAVTGGGGNGDGAPYGLPQLRRLSGRISRLRGDSAGMERELSAAGEWLRDHGLGPQISGELARTLPGALELRLPDALAGFEALPWELALVAGRTLAEHGVAVVRAADGGRPAQVPPPAQPLRMLGLFSLSDAGEPVDFGAHRVALRRQVLDGAIESHLPVQLTTRQFGVSRATFTELVAQGGGWDIVHIAAHGRPGGLLLSHEDGSTDRVPAEQLAALLAGLRGRVRLIVLSACWSGGQEDGPSNGQPGDHQDGQQDDQQDDQQDGQPNGTADAEAWSAGLTSVAALLAGELECAVVAMRFQVGAAFVLRFSTRLYGLLLGSRRESVAAAAQLALAEAVADPALPEYRHPLLSAGTPLLFGAAAATLRLPDRPLAPPGSTVRPGPPLPEWPESFVGRQTEMVRAAAALAPGAPGHGVLIRGARGMGATACATLLAHDHVDSFALTSWYPMPEWVYGARDAGYDRVPGFLRHLERTVPELAGLSAVPDRREALARVAARLRGGPRLLLVLDRADRLLAADPEWTEALAALTAPPPPVSEPEPVDDPPASPPPAEPPPVSEPEPEPEPVSDPPAAAPPTGRLLLTSRAALPDCALPQVTLPRLTHEEAWAVALSLPALRRLGAHDRQRLDFLIGRAKRTPGLLHEAAEAVGQVASLDDLQHWYPDT